MEVVPKLGVFICSGSYAKPRCRAHSAEAEPGEPAHDAAGIRVQP